MTSFMKDPLINLKRRSLGSKKGVECSIGLKYRTFKFCIYANLVILATAVTCYELSGGESGTLRWLRSLLDKLDISC